MLSNNLLNYINQQLDNTFPDNFDSKPLLKKHIDNAYDRMLYSLSFVRLNGYKEFSHNHSDLYAQFIYYLSNEIWKEVGSNPVSTKLFQLNKSLHSFNCMYDTILPDIFLLIHSVGIVLGKANYENFLVVCQNVTVGADRNKIPKFHGPSYLGPNSSVIGNCSVAEYSYFGIGAILLNQDSYSHSVVCAPGSPKQFLPTKRNIIDEIYFKHIQK